MSNVDFYRSIPPMRSISQMTSSEFYHQVPEDWYIAFTDVQGSTRAVDEGKYRHVVSVAAASITALININRDIDLPFVFGGDGATVLIPQIIVAEAREALLASQEMSDKQFGLKLRAGIMPVRAVIAAGYALRVAKLHISDNFQQALFGGGGVRYAETIFKDPQQGRAYQLNPDGQPHTADFTGFECRWNEIPAKYEEVISLIVSATSSNSVEMNRTYRDVIERIDGIYGDSARRHPIASNKLRLRLLPNQFNVEARIRSGTTRFKVLWALAVKTFYGRVAMWFNLYGWGQYKPILLSSTDNEKFDDALRMIFSGTKKQGDALRAYLEELREDGRIIYGVHRSAGVLMTCVVFNHFGKQVHFLDGANGGYTLAARQMKSQTAMMPAVNLPANDGV